MANHRAASQWLGPSPEAVHGERFIVPGARTWSSATGVTP